MCIQRAGGGGHAQTFNIIKGEASGGMHCRGRDGRRELRALEVE